MRAYWMMAANDPILAIYVTVTELPLKGKLTRLLSATRELPRQLASF
jgi:hypothetical protein